MCLLASEMIRMSNNEWMYFPVSAQRWPLFFICVVTKLASYLLLLFSLATQIQFGLSTDFQDVAAAGSIIDEAAFSLDSASTFL